MGALATSLFLFIAVISASFIPQQAFASVCYAYTDNATITLLPASSDVSSVASTLADTGDFSFLITGLVIVLSLVATSFIVISKRNVNTFSGEHSVSSVSSINELRKVLIVALSASLVIGSAVSFKSAFADQPDNEISCSTLVYYDSNYNVSSVDVSVVNVSNTNVTIPEEVFSSMYCGEVSSSENVDAGQTFHKIFYPKDKALSEGLIEKLVNSPVFSFENSVPAFFWVTYEGWIAKFLQNFDKHNVGIEKDKAAVTRYCLDNTCVQYGVPEISDYVRHYALEDGYTFVEWNTSADGTGETVDDAYLASHPLTSDVNYYAIWKKADVDSPSVDDSQNDNPAQPRTPDTPEVTDPDANIEADASKDNAEATEPSQDVEGTKEGDQAEQTV